MSFDEASYEAASPEEKERVKDLLFSLPNSDMVGFLILWKDTLIAGNSLNFLELEKCLNEIHEINAS